MDIKIGSKIHNRFDIEVRDDKTGELKQRGQAENIVLDRMYTRLCNFNPYFTNIVFGKGTGTLDPSRTTLFNRLGSKSAVTEETVKDFPISRWTRKITLNPEEFVGNTITEVGISDDSTNINTHALIKDAEGNQLSIEKTDTDVVIIYATVFIELQDKNEKTLFINTPDNNILLNYLVGSRSSLSSSDFYVQLGLDNAPNRLGDITALSTSLSSSNITRPTSNKVRFSYRYGINSGNRKNANIGLSNVFIAWLPQIGVFEGHRIEGKTLGIGDGNKVTFQIDDYNMTDIIIYKNGATTTDFRIEEKPYYIETTIRGIGAGRFNHSSLSFDGKYALVVRTAWSGDKYDLWLLKREGTSVRYTTIHSWLNLPSRPAQDMLASNTQYYFKIIDGSYVEVNNDIVTSINYAEIPSDITFQNIKTTDEVILKGYYSAPSGSSNADYYILDLKKGNRLDIIFNTPPEEGAIITADYTVPYIPKTVDYVLDVTAEISFGEGV